MVFSLLLSLLVQTLDPVVIHIVQYKLMTFVRKLTAFGHTLSFYNSQLRIERFLGFFFQM